MEEKRILPPPERLSILVATILLAYAMIPFVNLAPGELKYLISGVVIAFPVNIAMVISFLAAGLAGVGVDWLIQAHPRLEKRSRLTHYFIPALTAWVIGVPLSRLEVGTGWWVVFTLGGALMVLVFIAEYVSVDLEDPRSRVASIGLTALSFALYLVLTVALRGAGLRLYLILLGIVPTIGLIVLRTLFLRSTGTWSWPWAVALALLIGQLAVGLHYLPVTPLRYGLALTGVAYALTAMAAALLEKRQGVSLWLEPAIMTGLFGLLIVFIPL